MEKNYFSIKTIISRLKGQDHKIRFLLSRLLWISGLCRIFTINLSKGIKIKFYPTSTSTALWVDPNCFDSEGVDFIWDYLSEGDTFVDIGANIGHLTLIGAKKVGSGRVVSVEPHPRTFKFLNKNIKLNKLKNIKTYNFAIGDENNESLFSDIRSDDQNFVGEGGSVTIDIKRLDNLNIDGIVNLLKIDVEGYELFVLKGALETLSRTEAIYVEVYETNFERYSYHLKEILEMIIKNNFKVFRFIDDKNLQEINKTYVSQDCENLLAIKDLDMLKRKMNNFRLVNL